MGYNQNFPKLKKPKSKSPAAKLPKKCKTKSNPPQLGLNKAVRSCRACGNQVPRLRTKTAFGLPNIMNNARQNMRTRVRPRSAFNWRYGDMGLHKLVGK